MTVSFTQTTRLFLFALLTMSLVACGFHLRGNASVPAKLKVLTLTSESGSDSFERSLRIAFNKAGIVIVEKSEAKGNVLNLKITPITTADTELARDGNNDISQIQRRLSSSYFIRQADGKAVYGPRTISTSRTLTNQNADESAKISYNLAQEESMSEDLARQLIYDLNYAPF
ncbi:MULTISPECIES: hypothetical protein [Marinomonas]|uniref:LPS-assembly lipoprotein LptE n=1 Tax=Marinomonas arctica TaxID=383750 RepID=A0A7H1JA96_9GAMM|nr:MULTISPECIES: hypothetical protein [Marinomonas]MCS7486142.1 lipoprotein [Marinomonas sp. BSi20414]QNT07412.1 hypothetical protein IBG28_07285 [Marinomonas arctica]GGN26862.1 hypothetical protein GCM10011350_17760 [Marinomonas arctica]